MLYKKLLAMEKIKLINTDCVAFMKECEDKHFDLAIVDPPYGLNFGAFNRTNKDSNGNRYKANKYHNADWDKETPTDEYWEQLFRVSKNQIVWGGNYFPLPPTQCFIFWYKQNPVANFSDGELAWTSFNKPALCFDYRYYGNLEGKTSASEKIHPTQKPIQLYKWILEKFATPKTKILDTHLGSGSIAIAAHYFGCELTATEINATYYEKALKRFKEQTCQATMF
jgi:site-specific DNA-methyltransferase (adenine-specific)